MTETTSVERWRGLALRFHSIAFMVRTRRLAGDFCPEDLERIVTHEAASRCEKSVMRFLLHAWNDDNPFAMQDICGWDRDHLGALADWITGRATGEPAHYF